MVASSKGTWVFIVQYSPSACTRQLQRSKLKLIQTIRILRIAENDEFPIFNRCLFYNFVNNLALDPQIRSKHRLPLSPSPRKVDGLTNITDLRLLVSKKVNAGTTWGAGYWEMIKHSVEV